MKRWWSGPKLDRTQEPAVVLHCENKFCAKPIIAKASAREAPKHCPECAKKGAK